MVVEYGMSPLGPINFGPTMDVTDWGKSYWEQNSISQDVQAKIDEEVKKIITQCYDNAMKLIKEKRDYLDKVAESLVKKENMDKEEFEAIVGKKVNGENAKGPGIVFAPPL